ncbi:MAG: hypothetical protein WCC60_07385 [Ilumatobacteraceae bacterium]
MSDSLVDKGEDAEETDEARTRRRRRTRAIALGGSFAVVAVGAGVLVARPWATDGKPTTAASATSTLPGGAAGVEPTLSSHLVIGDIGEKLTVQWANDGEANAGQMGQPTGRRSMAMLAKPGATSDGPWLWAAVDLLDRFDRKSFDPSNYMGDPSGRKVMIGDVAGYYLDAGWTGSHMLVFGPVDDGFAVSFNANGLSQADMVAIAEELTLQEDADQALARPVFGPKAAELELAPVAAFDQDAWGFGGGAMISVGSGLTPFGSSVSYLTDKGHNVTVNNEPAPAGFDLVAVAKVMVEDAEEVTVHGLPAVKGSDQFSGDVVVWVEGGRSISVTGDLDDLVAAAEAVEEADGTTWDDLVAAAQATMGNPGAAMPETWLIGAGDLEDSTTWMIEGGVDDNGLLQLCSAAFSNEGGSMSGCNGATHEVAEPSVFFGDGVGMDGAVGVSIIATVPNSMAGAVLRFTGEDGTVTEVPLKVVRADWSFQAAAMAVSVTGAAVVIGADGAELANVEVTDDNLEAAGGNTATTVAFGGSAPADTVAAAEPVTTDTAAG